MLLGSEDKCVPIWPDEKRRRHYMQVDSSGFGAPDEYAFTAEQFYAAVRKIGPLRGYAIVEQGQFQVVVGVFDGRGVAVSTGVSVGVAVSVGVGVSVSVGVGVMLGVTVSVGVGVMLGVIVMLGVSEGVGVYSV